MCAGFLWTGILRAPHAIHCLTDAPSLRGPGPILNYRAFGNVLTLEVFAGPFNKIRGETYLQAEVGLHASEVLPPTWECSLPTPSKELQQIRFITQ